MSEPCQTHKRDTMCFCAVVAVGGEIVACECGGDTTTAPSPRHPGSRMIRCVSTGRLIARTPTIPGGPAIRRHPRTETL